MFSVENAGDSWSSLQSAVDRVVTIIQADPNKNRVDRVVTRWIKRHLARLGADINLHHLRSLTEDRDMLAENLENLVKKERQQGLKKGIEQGRRLEREAAEQRLHQAVVRMLAKGIPLTDVAEFFDLTVTQVEAIQGQQPHH